MRVEAIDNGDQSPKPAKSCAGAVGRCRRERQAACVAVCLCVCVPRVPVWAVEKSMRGMSSVAFQTGARSSRGANGAVCVITNAFRDLFNLCALSPARRLRVRLF